MDNVFDFTSDMSPETSREKQIIADKTLRRDLDDLLQKLKSCPGSRQRALAITKLEECMMWLGKDLQRLNLAD